MNYISPSGNDYRASVWVESSAVEGVRYRIARMSLSGRIELAKKLREIGMKVEFLEAAGTVAEKLEAAVARGEMERAYIEWGLREIHGLKIDGADADVASVIGDGPVALAGEIAAAVRRECGLTDEERKN